MRKTFFLLVSAILLAQCAVSQPSTDIRLSRLFCDHAVLQRDQPIMVWGWADPKDKLVINFMEKTYRATPDQNGYWKVQMKQAPAGGPYEMVVAGQKDKIIIRDIMLGDVWICSGQSNMEWPLAAARDAKQEIANANDPAIRHFKVPQSSHFYPSDTLVGGNWQVCSPQTAGNFTAVGYFFARHLRQHHDVTIGLLNSSWGGSRIEPWISATGLNYANATVAGDSLQKTFERQEAEREKAIKALLGDNLPKEDLGMSAQGAVWADPELDDKDWQSMPLPDLWENHGFQGLDGVVWFRKTIELSAVEAKTGITLGLGMIDDSDLSFINGRLAGKMDMSYNIARVYKVSPNLLKPGMNVITVRVEDFGGGGGIAGDPALLYYLGPEGKKSLVGDWKYKVGKVQLSSNFQRNQVPVILYNQMIHPIQDFPIKGVIWYQGESNAGWEDAIRYRELMPTLVNNWRSDWNCGEFPFLWVQLANFMDSHDAPSESAWALLREAQTMALDVPKTAQAVIIDIGEADDIHPRNKQDVGLRLALGARHLAYDETLVYASPMFREMTIEGNTIRLTFEHTGSGLCPRQAGEALQGFAVAGADKTFHWATAQIVDEQTIIVSCPQVQAPVAVRYAWADNPDKANLYNKEGLPADPFRTDDWQLWKK